MLRYLRNNSAQSVIGEYVLILFLIVGMMTAMTIYFRRTVQARIRDARHYMVETVRNRTGDYYNDVLYHEYEPYYANTDSTVRHTMETNQYLLPTGPQTTTGISRYMVNEDTEVGTIGNTAPPKDAK